MQLRIGRAELAAAVLAAGVVLVVIAGPYGGLVFAATIGVFAWILGG